MVNSIFVAMFLNIAHTHTHTHTHLDSVTRCFVWRHSKTGVRDLVSEEFDISGPTTLSILFVYVGQTDYYVCALGILKVSLKFIRECVN